MKGKIAKLFAYLDNKKEIVLIYQMGRVGSTSIERSLNGYRILFVDHIHSFNLPMVYDMFSSFNSVRYYIPYWNRIKHKIFNGIVKKSIIRRREVKIITLVREPIARNISMFFQDIHIPAFEIAKLSDNRDDNNIDDNALLDLYYNKFNHKYGVNWFDNEFRKSTGIDIYNYKFNKEKGYCLIREGNFKILILKMEKLSTLNDKIEDFLGINNFNLATSNAGKSKWYAGLYADFRHKFTPTQQYVDMLYQTNFMKHFYTELETNKFREYWLAKGD